MDSNRKECTDLKRQHTFIACVLIGIGFFYLLKQLNIDLLHDFYGWPTILMIIGIAFLINSIVNKDYSNIFTGTFLLGLGIHFHGLHHYSFWLEHWSVFTLLVGISLIIRSVWTKNGFMSGLVFTVISSLLLFNNQLVEKYHWSGEVIDWVYRLWPVVFIILGIYLLKRK